MRGSAVSAATEDPRGGPPAWLRKSAERLVDEAEVNLQGAREDHAWAPANRAVELIARLTGNLEPAAAGTDVHITKVTVVLPPGTPTVDAESYTVLPHGDEGADTEA